MASIGFFEQPKRSPLGLGAVLLLHAGVIGALLLIKGPEWVRPEPPLVVDTVPLPVREPEPVPERLPEPRLPVPPRSTFEVPPRAVPAPVSGPTVTTDPGPRDIRDGVGNEPVDLGPAAPPLPPLSRPEPPAVERPAPPTVRVAAEFDPRFARDQQPDYPAAEVRLEREGQVRLRVTIGPDGRVRTVSQISATSAAFWRATERHALTRWRFRPATLDGRPVESSKVMTVFFRLNQ